MARCSGGDPLWQGVAEGRVRYERFWALLATVGGAAVWGVVERRFGDQTGPRIEDERCWVFGSDYEYGRRAFLRAELSLRPPRSHVTALRRPEHVPSPSRAFPNAAEIGREMKFLTVYAGFGPS